MEQQFDSWEDLRAEALSCRRCPLCETRANVVLGVGSPKARVLFVGEGPGANEDAQGEPFVGRAGQLLDKMLVASGFSRGDNVYITNMVKCRPPENRDPTAQEIAACMGYLRGQVRLIRPQFIVCLGRIAAQSLISPDFRVTRQHGEFVEKNGVLMMGTYHPAALLRNSANKPDAFADLLALRDRMGLIG